MKEAPELDDTLKVFYQYTLPDTPILEIDDICITIEEDEQVCITVCDCEEL